MEFSLDRFRSAHEGSYDIALQEIKAGRKQSHWMWYIFPQILGLGHSTEAMYYAIQDKNEAVRYWNDPVVRSHMLEICTELLKMNGSIDWIMGYPDNLKLRSCMTLFWHVTNEPVFKAVLDKFYNGELDEYTRKNLFTNEQASNGRSWTLVHYYRAVSKHRWMLCTPQSAYAP